MDQAWPPTHNRSTERAPMRRGPPRQSRLQCGRSRSLTAVLFGDVRAGRAAVRSFVLDSSRRPAVPKSPLTPSFARATDGKLSCGTREWRSGQGCLCRASPCRQSWRTRPSSATCDRHRPDPGPTCPKSRRTRAPPPAAPRPRAEQPCGAASSASPAARAQDLSSVVRVIGDSVHPGQTTFTRPSGAIRTISFFRLNRRPPRIADFAAA